jgi:hypothetical protein
VVVEPGLVVGELVVGQDAGGGPSVFLAGPPVVRAVHRGGLAVAEDVDHALRLAFFRDSVDVSIAAGLRRALGIAAGLNKDIDVDAVIALWTDSPVRTDVAADFRDSRQLPTGGSPQIFWPDGSTTRNPGDDGPLLARRPDEDQLSRPGRARTAATQVCRATAAAPLKSPWPGSQ